MSSFLNSTEYWKVPGLANSEICLGNEIKKNSVGSSSLILTREILLEWHSGHSFPPSKLLVVYVEFNPVL